MKHKFSLIWRVAVALVLVLSFSLVAAVPAAASPDVSDVWVDLDVYTKNTSTIYHVYFTPGADLAEDVDTITVFFPIDTVPTDDVTVTVDPDGDAVAATTGTATADVAGYRLEVTTPVDITAGNEVRLDIPSVTNPTNDDDYTLNVYTSQETTQVESSTYTIGAIPVTALTSVVLTSYVAGAVAQYTIIIDQATALAVWDTITVVFPTGTGIPAMAASDVTIDTHALDTAPVIAGRFVTLTIPVDCDAPADPFTIVFLATAGITNPTYASTTKYVAKVYTSKDLGIVSRDLFGNIVAASISQVAFYAVTSDAEVMVTTASDIRIAELIIQTKDQYGNLKGVPSSVTVTFDLSSSSSTGVFTESNGTTVIEDINISSGAYEATFYYKDTAVGTATITAENAAHGWSDTWEIEVTSETAVELWDGDTLVGEYVTITDAINDALAGNVIKAGPGTYVEDITVNKADLTLESTDGKATTFIEGEMTLDDGANDFVLGGSAGKGFTLQGSDTADWVIMLRDPSDVEISYNTLDTTTTGTICDAIRLWGDTLVSGLTVTENTFLVTDQYDMGVRGHWGSSVAELTVTNNTFTGTDNTLETSAIEINDLDISSADTTISGNTMTSVGNAVIIGDWTEHAGLICHATASATLEISDNTFDDCNYGIDLVNATSTNTDQNVVITRNTFSNNTYGLAIDYGSFPVATDNWEPGDFTVKFNDFSGNTYGVYNNVAEDVDATHNYWGDDTGPSGEGTGMGDAISTYVDYEPWLVTTVSAGEWATGVTSLDARATVGVKVSGATPTDQKIGVARYTENPMATPEFTPLTDGFFDVYVFLAGDTTEIGIKFYADGMTAQSKVYVWDFFEEVWAECSNQLYNATYGYIWVKVHQAGVDVPTVPTISELAGTPFGISTAAPAVTKGDFDGDGDIDLGDFVEFAAAYGSSTGDPNYDAVGDFDDSGDIGLSDFVEFAAAYGA